MIAANMRAAYSKDLNGLCNFTDYLRGHQITRDKFHFRSAEGRELTDGAELVLEQQPLDPAVQIFLDDYSDRLVDSPADFSVPV